MAVDPSISLGVKPFVAPNPLEQYQGLLSLQNIMSEQALRKQQIQASQVASSNVAAEAKQRQSDQQDAATVQNLTADPNFQKAYGGGDLATLQSMLGGKVQPKTIDGLLTSSQTLKTAALAQSEKQATERGNFHNDLTNGFAGIDPTNDTTASDQLKSFLSSKAIDYPQYADKLMSPSDINPSNVRDALAHMQALNGILKSVNDAAIATREATNKANASGLKDVAPGAALVDVSQNTPPGSTPTSPTPLPGGRTIYRNPPNIEGELPLSDSQIAQANQQASQRYQVRNPGKPTPDSYILKPGSTQKDRDVVDRMLAGEESAAQAVAQQRTANAMHEQTLSNEEQSRQDRESSLGQKAVIGTDSMGKTVLVPQSQAKSLGLSGVMDAPSSDVTKAQSARQWIPLADNSKSSDPDKMGTLQLIDALDKKKALGPVTSRWNEFMTGKVGAGDITSDPETRAEYTALRTKMDLANTLLMNVHVGARGGSYMMENFKDLANTGKMSPDILKTAVKSEYDYAKDRAMLPTPAHVTAAQNAKVGDVIPLPGGSYVKKTGDNAFIHTDKEGNPQ